MTTKPIPGFPGYRATSDGRIETCRRMGCISGLTVNWRALQPGVGRDGYPRVILRKAGKSVSRRIHLLVALAFLGERPKGHQTCHNDGDRKSSSAANLRYATPSENMLDTLKHGTHSPGGEGSKLTAEKAVAIRKDFATGEHTKVELAKRYGVSDVMIHKIVTRQTWATAETLIK